MKGKILEIVPKSGDSEARAEFLDGLKWLRKTGSFKKMTCYGIVVVTEDQKIMTSYHYGVGAWGPLVAALDSLRHRLHTESEP